MSHPWALAVALSVPFLFAFAGFAECNDSSAGERSAYAELLTVREADWVSPDRGFIIHAQEGNWPDRESGEFDIRLIKQDVVPAPAPVAPALQPTVSLPSDAREFTTSLFQGGRRARSLISSMRISRLRRSSTNLVLGSESKGRVTTDAGSLLRKSSSAFGIGTQRRNPVVVDPRIRGSQVGQLAASGSYWLPARIDLDTMLSKLDSRIIDDVIVIKGPYSSLYGPDTRFIDVQFLSSPRSSEGFVVNGATSLNYQTNGEQWYGRQTVSGGAEDWGFRVGYGHKTGSDYESGDGTTIPSGYKSRDLDISLGFDISDTSSLEFNYLRLDQTDVEFPGQAFDLDYLVTDGYEATWTLEELDFSDRLVVDAWHNGTRFDGSAQRSGKRAQFPFYDEITYFGVTHVRSMSSGYRAAFEWDLDVATQFSAGTDLRFIRQSLDEIASIDDGFFVISNANSPIPKSHSANPGLFAELTSDLSDRLSVTLGGRIDATDVELRDQIDDVSMVGLSDPQSSLADILGTDDFDQAFFTWALFLTGEYELDDQNTLNFGAGHAERPPNLTEMYVAESFMFLLQNGLNTATGDPRLDPERLCQVDLGLEHESDRFRLSANAYHAWVNDYITFENLRVVNGGTGAVEQVSLKFVNTDLATLSGFDLNTEFDLVKHISVFGSASYVEGRDHTRNGSFATRPASILGPSVRDPARSRGNFSGVSGGSKEPLPSILPLESRLGIRLREPGDNSRWAVELAARVVDNQDRVATSLLETPTPGFTIWDVRGVFQMTESTLVVAGVENFTDKHYREHLDFRSANGIQMRQPGVNFYFGSEITY